MFKIANMNNFYHRYSLEYFLDSTVRINLQAIELWGGDPHLYVEETTHQEVVSILHEIKRRDLELVCFTPEQCVYPINLSAKNEKCRKRSIEYFNDCVEIANSLECSKLLITAGYGFFNEPTEEAWKRGRESIYEIARLAETAGVGLILEPLSSPYSNVVTNVRTLKQMITEVNTPVLKAMLDTAPMVQEGDTIDDYASAFGDDLVHIHFVDGDGGKTSAHLAWGEGCLPLNSFNQSLKKMNYAGTLTLELIGPQYNKDPEKALKQSVEFLITAIN
jgi:fructoselysine 3-epimerase